MSGWTIIKEGNVILEHLSTSSLIKITIESEEEIEYGKVGVVKKEVWLDYYEFESLKAAINNID
jgi:hypothetical protein